MRRVRTKSSYKLPTKPKEPLDDPGQFTGLIHGAIKIGKTKFLSQFPDVIFLTTEPGTKGLRIYEEPIGDWAKMRKVVKGLEQEPGRFKTVAIDTVDLAYGMCLDYVCEARNIPYPGEDSSGQQDYGESWKAVRDEFTSIINRIIRTGRGVWFTSHSKVETIKSLSGMSYERIVPTMSKQARDVVGALVDIVMYACFVKDAETGRPLRVLFCEGDETVEAGHRETAGEFPPFLELKQKGMWQTFVDAFNGEGGLDPNRLAIGRATPAVAAQTIQRARREAGKKSKKKAARRR